jgi:hypothetical protein
LGVFSAAVYLNEQTENMYDKLDLCTSIFYVHDECIIHFQIWRPLQQVEDSALRVQPP